MSKQVNINQGTICWNCANATGGCSWADKLVPVEGWTAEEVRKECLHTYQVYACPLFVQDAMNFGLYRLPKEECE